VEVKEPPTFLAAIVGDGRPLILLTALGLAGSGAFAWFLSATGAFLPHDVEFLGMQPQQLCAINQCRIVHFMFHDRVAFGGVLVSIATLYTWLALFPLRHGETWAWWTLTGTACAGFASFLSYLSYGYLDTWHGWATLVLLPVNVSGLWLTRRLVHGSTNFRTPGWTPASWRGRDGFGRLCLLGTGAGMIGAGIVILLVGMTSVFVPQDLVFLGLTRTQLDAINPRLIPLIAHDRAGFGGGLLTTGMLVFAIVWKARPSRPLWDALLVAGGTGFVSAIGVHYPIGYIDATHLAPAWAGSVLFTMGMVLSKRRYFKVE
jgi:hypothetical protein